MNLIGISINHRTSPIELRETVYLNVDEQKIFISKLKDGILKEGFVLSTCNRTEIFGIPLDKRISIKHLFDELVKFKSVEGLKEEHFERYDSQSSLKHIAKVASGIDSLILGTVRF